jgi:hypothetical protein
MFISHVPTDQLAGNGLLKRFHIDVGDLTSSSELDGPADGKLVYTLPEADFRSIISANHKSYLWRVVAAREDYIEGFPSVIQQFNAMTVVSDFDWTIDPVKFSGLTVTLGGKKSSSIKTISIDGNTGGTICNAPNEWSAEVLLQQTGQDFQVRAVDMEGNTSELKELPLHLDTGEQEYQPVWNSLDELGLLVDLPRIPQESNTGYKSRVIDTYVHRGGPRYKGLINGMTRELGLAYDDSGITLLPRRDETSSHDIEGIFVSIGSQYITVDSDLFINHREHHTVDTWDWSFELDNSPVGSTIIVESPLGTEIPFGTTWTVDDNKIVFSDSGLLEQPVYATYRYQQRLDLTTGTVDDVMDWLINVNKDNQYILDVSTGSVINTGSPASYLALVPRTEVVRNNYNTFGGVEQVGLPIRWTDGSIRKMNDPEFFDSKLNHQNTHFGTKMERWARFLQSYIHTQWGFLIADRNVWSNPEKPDSSFTSLPTTYDPQFSYWEGSSKKTPTRYSTAQAYAYNFVDPADGSDMIYKGIPSAMIRSGIGDSTDLIVKIVSEEATQLVLGDQEIISTISTSIQDVSDQEGDPIVNSGDGTSPGCAVLVL